MRRGKAAAAARSGWTNGPGSSCSHGSPPAPTPRGAAVLHHRRPHPRATLVRCCGPPRVPRGRRKGRGEAPVCAAPAAPRARVELAREGVPLNIIQRQLGHTNLGTTASICRASIPRRSSQRPAARRAPMMSATAGFGSDPRPRGGSATALPLSPGESWRPARQSLGMRWSLLSGRQLRTVGDARIRGKEQPAGSPRLVSVDCSDSSNPAVSRWSKRCARQLLCREAGASARAPSRRPQQARASVCRRRSLLGRRGSAVIPATTLRPRSSRTSGGFSTARVSLMWVPVESARRLRPASVRCTTARGLMRVARVPTLSSSWLAGVSPSGRRRVMRSRLGGAVYPERSQCPAAGWNGGPERVDGGLVYG